MRKKTKKLYRAVMENSGLASSGICEFLDIEAYNIEEVKKEIESIGYDSKNWSIENIG